MVEFGEKLRQLREERGMTQQTVAEKLYVTRQAVSRWECGARYPDLLTAKKIAQILNVTIDELLSGEELKESIERQPVLTRPIENIVQSVLYTIAMAAYLLMTVFGVFSFFPTESLAATPAGQIHLDNVIMVAECILCLAAVSVGIILSVHNKLTAKFTGYIMCLPYAFSAGRLFITFIEMQIRQNGYLGIGWFVRAFIPAAIAVYVWMFFVHEGSRLPYVIILLICICSAFYILLTARHVLMYYTELGLVVYSVECLGRLGMVFLLGYQAYVWNRKKKIAIRAS